MVFMNNFVWTDLSTFDIEGGKEFYQNIFGWQFQATEDQSMSEKYEIAYQGDTPVSALFVMLPFLQKINMPSFWMSYIQVGNIQETVEKARKHKGVVVEVEPTAFNENSKIALVRDPSGAGFTLFQGEDLQGRFTDGHGRMIWNVHHLQSVDLVRDFYNDLFGWNIVPSGKDKIFDVQNKEGKIIATIEEHSDEVRNNKSYWMPIFAVDNVQKTKRQIEKLNGRYIHDISGASMFSDQQGGHFLIKEDMGNIRKIEDSKFLWKTLLVLAVVVVALAIDLGEFVFGILFLIWTWYAIQTGQVYLVESVQRSKNPVLFWGVVSLYLLLSAYSVLTVLG